MVCCTRTGPYNNVQDWCSYCCLGLSWALIIILVSHQICSNLGHITQTLLLNSHWRLQPTIDLQNPVSTHNNKLIVEEECYSRRPHPVGECRILTVISWDNHEPGRVLFCVAFTNNPTHQSSSVTFLSIACASLCWSMHWRSMMQS